MSRRNYRHTMDSLIGKPLYYNSAGPLLDPNTGLEAPTTVFRAEEVPTNEYTSAPIPPIAVVTAEGGDLENSIMEERKKAEALRLANLTEAEKAERERRIQLMVAQREARKIAKQQPIIVPVPYIAPPLVIGGGGGGGGAMGEPSRTAPSAPTVAKPSFLKKNFIPLLLVAGAIFVFIKKPIK